MSHNDDFIAQLEDYLEAFDGATPLPNRVRDAIRAELPSARQVQPRTGPKRMFTMLAHASAGARIGLAAAAVVVVVLGAALLNNGRSGGVGGGAATPTPTATTAPSPSPTAATPAPSVAAGPSELKNAPVAACGTKDTTATGCLAPGTYQLNHSSGPNTWPVLVTLDLPAGWFDWDAAAGYDGVLVASGPDGASGWGVMFATVGDVSRDPCDSAKGVIPAAQVGTPEKLAAAMAAWPRFKATAAQPITVDGHRGLKLQLTSTASSTCNDTGSLWKTTSGGSMDVYPMISSTAAKASGTFEIVDTGHGLLVIRATDFPQTSPFELAGGIASDPTRHAADQTELRTILGSIRIADLPASP